MAKVRIVQKQGQFLGSPILESGFSNPARWPAFPTRFANAGQCQKRDAEKTASLFARVSKATFVRHYGFTQAGARIFELENEHDLPVEHSKDTDSHGFKRYRIIQETDTLSSY